MASLTTRGATVAGKQKQLLRLYGDESQNRNQDATQNALPNIGAINEGTLVEYTAAGGNIAHKLGRRWVGCFAVLGAPITSASTSDDALFVGITATTAGKAWVF